MTAAEYRQIFRFNRNIVECKYESFKGLGDTVHVLIETLWNVNANGTFMIHKPTNVLIETLWNVNLFARQVVRIRIRVLIETLWNVNEDLKTNFQSCLEF